MDISNILYIPKLFNELFFASNNNYSKYIIFMFLIIAILCVIIGFIKKMIFNTTFIALVLIGFLFMYSYIYIKKNYSEENSDNFNTLSNLCVKNKKLTSKQKTLCKIYTDSKKDYHKIGSIVMKQFNNN